MTNRIKKPFAEFDVSSDTYLVDILNKFQELHPVCDTDWLLNEYFYAKELRRSWEWDNNE